MDSRVRRLWEFDGKMVEKGDRFLVEYIKSQRFSDDVLTFDGKGLRNAGGIFLEMDSYLIAKMTRLE